MLENYMALGLKPRPFPENMPLEEQGLEAAKTFPNGLSVSVVSFGSPRTAEDCPLYGTFGQAPEKRRHEVHIGVEYSLLKQMSLTGPEYNVLACDLKERMLTEAGIVGASGFEHAYLSAHQIDCLLPVLERQPKFDCSPYDNPNGRAQLKDRTIKTYKELFDCELAL